MQTIRELINWRAHERWSHQHGEPREECAHEETEIRRRVVKGGMIQIVHQCLLCGDPVGQPISKNKVASDLPFFDDELQQQARQTNAHDQEYFRKLVSKEFWAWYNAYLASAKWRDLRAKVMQRDRGVCQGCGATATQVHHLTYDNVGDEFLFELIAICDPCHNRLHPPDKDDSFVTDA